MLKIDDFTKQCKGGGKLDILYNRYCKIKQTNLTYLLIKFTM